MPLVFLPDAESLFHWGDGEPPLGLRGEPGQVTLVTPEGRVEVSGVKLGLVNAISELALVPTAALEDLPASAAIWAYASKLAVELIARERVVPTISRRGGRTFARWAAALSAEDDAGKIAALAQAMPPAAHAVPVDETGTDVWAPPALLRAYLDAVVDVFVRASRGGPELPKSQAWDKRWQRALEGKERAFEAEGFGERTVLSDLERWSEPALGARDRLRVCFRLELPAGDRDPFLVRFLVQSPDDPSLLASASDVWTGNLERLGRAFHDPGEALLEGLGRAARLYGPIDEALAEAKPEALALDPAAAWTFLGQGAPILAEAGFGVIVPGELTASGQRRLRARMRVGGSTKVAGAVTGAAGLGLDTLLKVDWEAVIGDQVLTAKELTALAKQKAPLVRHRGVWVAIDPRELDEIQRRLAAGPSQMLARDAMQAALAGEMEADGLAAQVVASGSLLEMLERLRGSAERGMTAPKGLNANLRPYQERGLAWLATMGEMGLGACLADDMGLGKTIQLLAFLVRRAESLPDDPRPALLVAPTSVLGNWEREAARFAPSLTVVAHHGGRRGKEFPPRALVLTSYGTLRRDAALLGAVDWSVVALDEAQNIKNSASATARAARTLRASHRFALTGTPVENRLAELWSILEFANPGMLGALPKFRQTFAVPIERYANDSVAARLRKIVGPFVLRRVKSDPAIISDLPPKNEMKVICTLTREQATLYKAVVDEEMKEIESSEGIARRGRVLALLTHLKQICNHPAQYLSEKGPLDRRSGKLARVTEMLEEALAAGDKALVFTQYREMGDRLVEHLQCLGAGIQFLHGGTARGARDEMVRAFQEDARGPRIFILSLKAGGTGLNLTAASHVFHYDRWWNPAVEDQATDRAYRIGQKRSVQVHKLMCAGTVEEKVDGMLEQKRGLAAKVVGAGENWITELADGDLRELFALSGTAVVTDEEEAAAARPRRRARP